ncbi:hypothetical protein DPEC_G00064360 [Dallia pectoralis]|uniref:Uncharacterized protein n=1 Tax=Dallia pectoralis TaxID=75939 RepID=A0ACC2H8F1_DALPE|nr:hypothetical protein DPEC_G00064360 [Dallia pectoralis]
MEPPSPESKLKCQFSQQECQICLNCYSSRRKPKLLDCQHTCCSLCLTQMRRTQKELRCPWCRCVTLLPQGVTVSQLPDDPDTMAVLPVFYTPAYTPVFLRLHGNTYYLPMDYKERAQIPGEHLATHPLTGQLKEMPPVRMLDERIPGLGEEHEEREEGGCKSLFMTRACLVVLLGIVLFLMMYIVLQNILEQVKKS